MSARPWSASAIIAGTADAARDAGLTHFVVGVSIEPALVELPNGPALMPEIKIEIVELTPEESAALAADEPN